MKVNDYILLEKTFTILPGPSRLDGFIQDSLRPVSKVYIAFLCLFFVIAFGVYSLTKGSTYGSIWPNQILFYTVLAVHVGFRLKQSRENVLSPEIFFLIFYTLFHLGYITLYSLNLVPSSSYVFFYESSIPKAMFVINLGLLGFLFGWEITGCRARSPILPIISVPKSSWEILGVVLLLLSILMHFVGLTLLGWDTVFTYGYDAIQNLHKYTSYSVGLLIQYSNPLMVIGMTLAVIASAFRHQQLFHSKMALVLTVICFGIMIMEGERETIVKLAVPLHLVRHFFIRSHPKTLLRRIMMQPS
jgi:hypothetical protein